MNLSSPPTLLAAWLLLPAAVTAISLALGVGLARVSGKPLGLLTAPAGFLAGIVVMAGGLQAGLPAEPLLALTLAAALAGAAAWGTIRRRQGGGLRPTPESMWAAAAVLLAFLLALAPLALTGRSGVLGYLLNNDPAQHIPIVEQLRDFGARAVDPNSSSYAAVTANQGGGYPVGSHVWVLIATMLGGVDPFHLWTPLVALSLALLALPVLWLLRRADAPLPFAGIAAGLIPLGYLTMSYMAQGGMKEVQSALAVATTAALLTIAIEHAPRFRTVVPAAVGGAATVYVFGLGGLAWVVPAALAALVVLLARRRDAAIAGYVVAGVALMVVIALPALLDGAAFLRNNDEAIANPAQTGNLYQALPLRQTLGVWLARDYRLADPEQETWTLAGSVIALLLAVVGLVVAIRRRQVAFGIYLAAAWAGLAIIWARYAIYFQAKAYVVLAPAVLLASALGALALWQRRGAWRAVGTLAATAVTAGVLVSWGYVYSGVWLTPEKRFEELAEIGQRFAGQGPMLVNQNEAYAKYFLRDTVPWESWGHWQPSRGFRFGHVPLPPPRTPDLDDYTDAHMRRFNLILQPAQPGGSAPPAAYRKVFESEHYTVWRRSGPGPIEHLPLGAGGLSGTATLDCSAPELRAIRRRARRAGRSLVVATRSQHPVPVRPAVWVDYSIEPVFAPPPMLPILGGRGLAGPIKAPPPGRYRVFMKGSFGSGVALNVGTERIGRRVQSLSIFDTWHPFGVLEIRSREALGLALQGLYTPRRRPGSRRPNVVGPVALEPVDAARAVTRVDADGLARFCGRRVDWIELVGTNGPARTTDRL